MRLIHYLLTSVILFSMNGHAGAASATPPLTITRHDLAIAYLRFERAYAAHPPTEANRAAVNRAFDQATMLYFTARSAEAIAALNELTDSLAQPTTRPAAAALIQSLQVRLAPPVARRDRPSVLRVRVAPMYSVPVDGPVDLRLSIRSDSADSQNVFETPIRFEPGGPPITLTQGQPQAAIGRYVVELKGPDGAAHPVGRWSVIETPLDVLRLNNERRLHDLRPSTPQMRQALVACQSRNALLSDRPDENNSAQFLSDPIELSREVQSEVEWLTMGKDPYANRVGDYWRAILAGAMPIPARIYAPRAANNNKPMPLLLVLHGAGADESIFMAGLGNGQIKRLAEKNGLVVASLASDWIVRNPAVLDPIIEAMSLDYPIDPARVYIIGHSLGAMAAEAMAARQPDQFAGMVLFAGGQFTNVAKLPPTLVYSGELDPIVPPAKIQAAVEQAKRNHLPVELRTLKDRGHTLIVNDALGEGVEWLLMQRGQ